jgi:hypothetical protein
VRIALRLAGDPAARIASATPSWASAFIALGVGEQCDPSADGFELRRPLEHYWFVARRRKAIAALSPPMPPPTTMTRDKNAELSERVGS